MPPPAFAVVVVEAALNEALPEVPAAPSDDLLSMARRALDEGRPGEAVVLARGAALRRLGVAGQLRLEQNRRQNHALLQGDLDGNGSSDFEVMLMGPVQFSASNLILA